MTGISAHFEYGTDPTLQTFISTGSQAVGSGTTALSINAFVGSLASQTTYYYRLVATNGSGTQIGAGGIMSFLSGVTYVAVGDSITAGSGDDILSDGVGYEPILGTLLTAAKGYPISVVNEGVSGATSAMGASTIDATLAANPSAKYFLILYGTNDADAFNGPGYPVSKATYIANIQTIVTAVKNAGKTPYLAKVPYATAAGFSDVAIQQYNQAINDFVADPLNGISVVPPDFYAWFQSHTSQLADGIHPNGTGYQSMANLWFNALP
jgi:lysophospholipase L1-like esterase